MKYRILQTDKAEFYPQYRWSWIPFYWHNFVVDHDYYSGRYYQSYSTYDEAVDAIDKFTLKLKKEKEESIGFKEIVHPYVSKITITKL